MSRPTLLLALPMLLIGAAAASRPSACPRRTGRPDMMHMMSLGAHNQLGVLQYCQAKGALGADKVALQQKMIGMLPATSTEGFADAEAVGKTGTVSFGGSKTSLEEAAKAQNTTVAALCGKLGDALANAAKNLPQ